MKQPKRGRLWLNDGSCVRLRSERPNHVWSYDFVQDRTHDGRAFRMLVVLDEFTRRCLAIVVARRLRSDDVLQCLADLFVAHGPPEHVRSDNQPIINTTWGSGPNALQSRTETRLLREEIICRPGLPIWQNSQGLNRAALPQQPAKRCRHSRHYRRRQRGCGATISSGTASTGTGQ
jgi:transposase InsO family protein